jgi:NADPH-dependent glutamate synthase beta subunit-like oxidoreductase
VVVRSGFEEMKASPWEKEDAMHEGIPILNFLVPKEVLHEAGKLTGMVFEKVKAEYDAKGRRQLVPSGEPDVTIPCDDVLVAIGQEIQVKVLKFDRERTRVSLGLKQLGEDPWVDISR